MALAFNARGGGGGSTTVGCVLEVYPLDVHGHSAAHDCLWNHLYNNPYDLTPLGALPAGLGLTVAFNGTDATITTTAAGVWAFTLGFSPPQDATWKGVAVLDTNTYGQSALFAASIANTSPGGSVSETIKVPAGYSFVPQIITETDATANPLSADVYLNIVRLA